MQVKKNTVQQAIINAAKDEFFENGYSLTTVRSIARRAGISVSNLYRYFISKQDLFEYITEPQAEKILSLYNKLDHAPEKPLIIPASDEALLYAVRRWAETFDILYNIETYMILNADGYTGYADYENKLADKLTYAVMKLCGRSPEMKIPEKYPLDFFVRRLIAEMKITALTHRHSKQLRAILKNQLISAVLGFVISLA